MSTVEPTDDPIPGDDDTDPDSDSAYLTAHYALAGGMLCFCAVAVLVVSATLVLRSSSHAATDVTPSLTPTTQLEARRVTTATTVHPGTAVKQHPRSTTTPTVAPMTVPVPTTIPVRVGQVRTPPRRAPVVQVETVATQPPTTQPQQMVVPYTPPTQAPPDSVEVPFVPTSTPSG